MLCGGGRLKGESGSRDGSGVFVPGGFVKRKTAAASLLSEIHGGVGVFEQLIDAMVIMRVHGNTDTDADRDGTPFQLKSGRDGLGNAFCHDNEVLLGRDP